MNPLPPYQFCDRECETGSASCGPCARERAWLAERDEWKGLAQELRVQEARISGVLCDVDWADPDSMSLALDTISVIMSGEPGTTSPQRGGNDG